MKSILRCLLVAALTSQVISGQQTRSPSEALTAPQRQALIDERDRLWDSATELRKRGDFSAAIAKAEEVLAIEKRVFGNSNEEVAGTLDLLAWCLELRGDL